MRQNSISIIEFQSIFYYLLWRRILNIIPLPYVKVFTNNKGDIEVLCNLTTPPELECKVLATFLVNPLKMNIYKPNGWVILKFTSAHNKYYYKILTSCRDRYLNEHV
jgi:hypothetical protein